jgi:hypothetical protein
LGHDEYRRRTREAGFDYHLVKPVGRSAINELLERVVKVRKAVEGVDRR